MELFLTIFGVVVSIVLGVVAIWLSIYFFMKGKDTETNIRVALAEIREQTGALERIAGRQLDRLTKAIATPRGESLPPKIADMLAAVTQYPGMLLEKDAEIKKNAQQVTATAAELRSAVIAVRYYSALANV